MSETKAVTDGELERIVAALADYNTGSSRAALVPIDEAVCACLKHPARQALLEQLLVAQLRGLTSSEARLYICQKLRLIGSATAVPALVELLPDPLVGDFARGTLESLPVPEAGAALRLSLPQLSGTARLGVVDALGYRREPGNLAVLESGLKDPDQEFVAAAVTAISRLGTVAAAEVLQRNLAMASASNALRLTMAHACLDCAWTLRRAGHRDEADGLCRRLTEPGWPELVAQAARRELDSAGE